MPIRNPFRKEEDEEEESGLRNPFSQQQGGELKNPITSTEKEETSPSSLNNPFGGKKISPAEVAPAVQSSSSPSVSVRSSAGEPIPSTIARPKGVDTFTPTVSELSEIPAKNFDLGTQEGMFPSMEEGIDAFLDFAYATKLPVIGMIPGTKKITSNAMKGIADGVIATYLRAGGILSDKAADIFASSLWSLPDREDMPRVEGSGPFGIQTPSETAEWSRLLQNSKKTALETGLRDIADQYDEELDELLQQDGIDTLRKVSRDATRFLLPYLAFKSAVGPGTFAQNYIAAPLADLAAFTHKEERLSNQLADANVPIISEAVGKYMAADEDDSEAMGMLKQSLEGIFLGKITDSAMAGVGKIFSTAKSSKAVQKAVNKGLRPGQKGMPTTSAKGWELEEIDVKAAQGARELLTQDISMAEGENVLEVAESLFHRQLRNNGVWDKLDPEDQIAKLEWFKARAAETFDDAGKLKKPVEEIPEVTFDTFDKHWKKNQEQLVEYNKQQSKKTLKHRVESFKKNIFDRSSPLRKELSKTPEGQLAERRFALSAGASGKSARDIDIANREIFRQKIPGVHAWKSLDKAKRENLDKLITLRRFRTIKSYDPSWAEKGNPLTQHKEEFYSKQIDRLREQVGEADFADLSRRSNQYFENIIKPLDDLLDAEVISKEEWKKLSRFSYSPMKWIDTLDQPIAQYVDTKGRPITVSRSGIEPLSSGKGHLLETDTQSFLEETVIRSNAVAARNRANLALYDLAKRGDSPIVTLKPPKGAKSDWVKIDVMKKGNARSMYLAKEYADQWTTGNQAVLEDSLRKTLQVGSASPVTRFFATGPGNPEFAITNFPRDAMYGILVSDQYNGFLPFASAQYVQDIAEVTPDAIFRRGQFDDYIREGGGMEFLSQQGVAADYLREGDLDKVFSYFNVTSEVINRLAVRNRAIKNIRMRVAKQQGIPVEEVVLNRDQLEEATYVARTTIDFAQGGRTAKVLNEAVPYFNAAMQGMRGYARSWKKNPAKAAAYAGQLLGIYGAFHVANRSMNPEATADTPKYVSDNYLSVPTPLSFIDEEGDRRYLGFRMPVDQSSVGLKIAAEALVDKSMNKGLPGEPQVEAIDRSLRALKSTFSIVPGMSLPPTISALMAMGANYDWWRQAPVWSGDQNIPEHLKYTPGRTPEVYQDIGKATGLSPANLDAAIRQVVPPSVYSYTLGMGYKELTEGIEREKLDPVEKQMIEEIQSLPGIRRLTYLTSPHSREADAVDESIEEAKDPQVRMNRDVDNLALRVNRGVEGMDLKDGLKWIQEEVPPELQKNAQDRLVNAVRVDKVLKELNYNEKSLHLPSQRWWNRLSSAPPHAKAKELASHLSAINALPDSAQKKEAKKVFRAMMTEVPGFNPQESDKFALYLKRELERQGMDADDALY